MSIFSFHQNVKVNVNATFPVHLSPENFATRGSHFHMHLFFPPKLPRASSHIDIYIIYLDNLPLAPGWHNTKINKNHKYKYNGILDYKFIHFLDRKFAAMERPGCETTCYICSDPVWRDKEK